MLKSELTKLIDIHDCLDIKMKIVLSFKDHSFLKEGSFE